MAAQQNAEYKTFCLWHLGHVPGVIIRNEKWKIYFHFSAATKGITRTATASDHFAIIYVNCNEAEATFITLSVCPCVYLPLCFHALSLPLTADCLLQLLWHCRCCYCGHAAHVTALAARLCTQCQLATHTTQCNTNVVTNWIVRKYSIKLNFW